MNDFDDLSDRVILVIDHQEYMSNQTGLLWFFLYNLVVRMRSIQLFWIFALSIMINIILLLFVDVSDPILTKEKVKRDNWYWFVYTSQNDFIIAHLIVSFIFLLNHCITETYMDLKITLKSDIPWYN